MSQPDAPNGEDYSYDLAHDVPGRRSAPPEPGPARREPRRSAAPGGPQPDGDYSYDEAHDRP
jgi:hypothetical protein